MCRAQQLRRGGGRAGEDLENFGGHLANLIARCERAGRRKRGRRGGDLVRGRAVPDRELAGEHQTERRTDPDHERLQRRPLATRAETWLRAARRPSPSNQRMRMVRPVFLRSRCGTKHCCPLCSPPRLPPLPTPIGSSCWFTAEARHSTSSSYVHPRTLGWIPLAVHT